MPRKLSTVVFVGAAIASRCWLPVEIMDVKAYMTQ
jgi:hypothetical protein